MGGRSPMGTRMINDGPHTLSWALEVISMFSGPHGPLKCSISTKSTLFTSTLARAGSPEVLADPS